MQYFTTVSLQYCFCGLVILSKSFSNCRSVTVEITFIPGLIGDQYDSSNSSHFYSFSQYPVFKYYWNSLLLYYLKNTRVATFVTFEFGSHWGSLLFGVVVICHGQNVKLNSDSRGKSETFVS